MSKTFTANDYDISRDRFEYRDYTRESLLDRVVLQALAREYSGVIHARNPGTGKAAFHGILSRLLRIGLSDGEVAAIKDGWRDWWTTNEGRIYEQVVLVPFSG